MPSAHACDPHTATHGTRHPRTSAQQNACGDEPLKQSKKNRHFHPDFAKSPARGCRDGHLDTPEMAILTSPRWPSRHPRVSDHCKSLCYTEIQKEPPLMNFPYKKPAENDRMVACGMSGRLPPIGLPLDSAGRLSPADFLLSPSYLPSEVSGVSVRRSKLGAHPSAGLCTHTLCRPTPRCTTT